MKTGRDNVLIRLKSPVIDKRGHIHMLTSTNKQQHFESSAVVVATPIHMSRNMYLPQYKTKPLFPSGIQGAPEDVIETDEDEFMYNASVAVLYSEETAKRYSYADIVPEVMEGDKIYFNWMSLGNKRNFVKKSDAGYIYKVRYENIYCLIRDGKIIPVGDYALIEPDMETFQDILIPLYYPAELTGGKKVLRPQSEWLQAKAEPEAKELRGTVKYVGSPFKCDRQYVKPGDYIWFMKGHKLTVEIEGTKYYAIRQSRIMAIDE